jgi:hypothetical protein
MRKRPGKRDPLPSPEAGITFPLNQDRAEQKQPLDSQAMAVFVFPDYYQPLIKIELPEGRMFPGLPRYMHRFQPRFQIE